jgi:archaemetzincin
MEKFKIFLILITFIFVSCKQKYEPRYPIPSEAAIQFNTIQDSLVNLHSELAPPKDGDWLIDHPETGQTFKEYIHTKPLGQTETRTKLYLAILSNLDSIQMSIALQTKEYLSIFYQCETELITLKVDYSAIPEKYYRNNEKEEIQVLTDFFLKKLLVDNLPADAFAMIGCTTYDIFPDPQWNFVFGQASLNNRVGVWSMRRLGNPTEYPDMLDKAILRNLKIASHETGHILSMKHCIYYDCIMNGSAHISETDNKPVYLCPVCLGKVDYNRHFALQDRFQKLETFWTENKLSIYHQYYEIVKEIKL